LEVESALFDAGGTAATAAGYDISSPLFPPVFHPPSGVFATAAARPINGVLDIGALERPSAEALFADGFEGEALQSTDVDSVHHRHGR